MRTTRLEENWNSDFQEEMLDKRKKRSEQVGGHSYVQQIERYGLGIMFAEIANIVSRLEMMLWENDPSDALMTEPDRLLDLLVDLGNYTMFTYETAWMLIRQIESEGLKRTDSDSPLGEDPGKIVLSQREREQRHA